MGMVPSISKGVWIGGDDSSIHFEEIGFEQGATMELPIWGSYMKALYQNPDLGVSVGEFFPPEKQSISVDCYDIIDSKKKKKPKLKADLDALNSFVTHAFKVSLFKKRRYKVKPNRPINVGVTSIRFTSFSNI